MSYILEALKKSQQERELGRVPRLESIPFDEPVAAGEVHPWLWVSVLLALVAVGLALYAAMRAGTVAAPGAAGDRPRAIGVEVSRTSAPAPAVPELAAEPAVAADESPAAAPAAGAAAKEAAAAEAPDAVPPLPASDDGDLSVEPQVLVVPAPPKPGQRLPRGADELRRAVLGPAATPSVSVDASPARRRHSAPPEPENAPVPDDLIADIEAFKRQVGNGGGHALPAEPRAPAQSSSAARHKPAADHDSARHDGAPVPPPSAALRRKLPEFLMTVHVYDADPSRRFVYINGRKVGEHQTTREGLRVEQVMADGAVLSWQGERFFQRR